MPGQCSGITEQAFGGLTIGGLGLGSVETSSNEQDSSSGTFGNDIGDAQYSVAGIMYI